ncbi:MAG: hypothetical protein R6V47_03500, partial [Candidatus Delongbacteria bacterium]
AVALGKRFKDYIGLFRLYSKHILHLIGTGKWREVEINIRFSSNLLIKISNKDEIKRFVVNMAYYYYIIKDPEEYFSLVKNILNSHPALDRSDSFRTFLGRVDILFGMYSRENSEAILREINKVPSKMIRMLMVVKYFNNSLNNYDEKSINKLKKQILDLKNQFRDMPHISDYFYVLECLLNEDYVNSLKVTVKLGKENYSKGYIFDSYFAILSSYFYFKNRSLYRNAEFFEEKLNLLSSKIAANMPAEKRDGFQNRYWVI